MPGPRVRACVHALGPQATGRQAVTAEAVCVPCVSGALRVGRVVACCPVCVLCVRADPRLHPRLHHRLLTLCPAP